MVQHDISKSTVMILLVLTIILSALGTFAVFQATTMRAPVPQGESQGIFGAGEAAVPGVEQTNAAADATVQLVVLPQGAPN